jgi:hypothetical protein
MSVSKRPPGVKSRLVIDSTGLKVFGEGEWKVRKHGKEHAVVSGESCILLLTATHMKLSVQTCR